MRASLTVVMPLALLIAAGCGGGSDPVPLVSGSLAGDYQGEAFTPTAGIALLYTTSTGSANLIGFGTGNLNCSSPYDNDPPSGITVIFAVDSFAAGTYSDVVVQLADNRGAYEGHGANGGLVTITASTADSIAGTITWSYTDQTDGQTYSIDGTFEVTRCP